MVCLRRSRSLNPMPMLALHILTPYVDHLNTVGRDLPLSLFTGSA
jgi:hypothetical protein